MTQWEAMVREMEREEYCREKRLFYIQLATLAIILATFILEVLRR